MTHRDRSEYKTDSSVMAVCKPVTIPGMTGHVRRNTHSSEIIEKRNENFWNVDPRKIHCHSGNKSIHGWEPQNPEKGVFNSELTSCGEIKTHRVFEKRCSEHAHDVKPQPFLSKK